MSVKQTRYLRRNSTVAEKRLWSRFRNRKAVGLKFRRQQPIADRVVDFYCEEGKLAVELDGAGHNSHVGEHAEGGAGLEGKEQAGIGTGR